MEISYPEHAAAAALGISLAVGHLTLDQVTEVRILDPQPKSGAGSPGFNPFLSQPYPGDRRTGLAGNQQDFSSADFVPIPLTRQQVGKRFLVSAGLRHPA